MLEKFRNKFIVLEGYEEAGKTSVGKLLVDHLNKNDIPAIFSFQPGDDWGPLAPLMRSLCKDKRLNLCSYANLFAFLLDRAECIDKIVRPALKEGKTVVLDRYTYSTIAYQLFGKELWKEINEQVGNPSAYALFKWFKNPYPDVSPDSVLYFPMKVGNRKNNKNDLFDNEVSDFENRVKGAYSDMLHEEDNWYEIIAGDSVEATLEKIFKVADVFWK